MRNMVRLAVIGTLLMAAALSASDLTDNGNPWIPGPAMPAPDTQDSLEYFGGTANTYSSTANRVRGNFYYADKASILTEQRIYLNTPTEIDIWFLVYESNTQTGTYQLIDSTHATLGPGLSWYGSGPRNVQLDSGKYYFITAQWVSGGNSITYYRSPATYPVPASFGSLVGTCGATWAYAPAFPPKDTLEIPANPFAENVAYCQALITYQQPRITWSSPPSGAVGVQPAQPIRIAFSEPMNPATLGYSCTPTISVYDTWNATHDTVTLRPTSLSPGTTYSMILSCQDQYGHGLGGSTSLSFTTAAGDSLEYIGSSTQVWSGAPRMRGNFFLCDANTVVKEYRWYLDPADTANVWFAIYEGATAGGTFNLKYSKMVRTPDVTQQWYTTGPMNMRMEAGKYYFYAMVWDSSVSVSYYRGTVTYPYPYSFGDLVGLCGLAGYANGTPVTPPQDTLEVPAGAFSGDMAYYLSLLTIPENSAPPILVFEETPGDTAYYYYQAASNLGYNTVVTTSQSAFIDSLYNGTNWTMALVNNFNTSPTAEFLDTMNHYLLGGGKAAFYTWNFAANTAHPLFATLGASYVGDLTAPVNVHAKVPTDVLFTTPNQVNPIYWKNDIWTIDCTRLAPANGGKSVAYLEGYDLESCLIANAGMNSLFNSFESVDYSGDDDYDGKKDMVELIENEIVWLLGPTPLGVAGKPVAGPAPLAQLSLGANYPNPFRSNTTIEFNLPKADRASLKVYNLLGQTVATLVDGQLSAGNHRATWNARGVANGIYLYQLTAGGRNVTRKLVVVK